MFPFPWLSFNMTIRKEEFYSKFALIADGGKTFKKTLNDIPSDAIELESRYQTLILTSRPIFKQGQQIEGFLFFTSEDYFAIKTEDRTYLKTNTKAKIYFRCITHKFKKKKFPDIY